MQVLERTYTLLFNCVSTDKDARCGQCDQRYWNNCDPEDCQCVDA